MKKELNERAKNFTNYEEAIPVVKDYESIIRSKKKQCLMWYTEAEFCLGNLKIQQLRGSTLPKLAKLFDKY